MNYSLSLFVLFGLALGSGCASVTSSKNQPISVDARCGGKSVVGASCELTNSKGKWYANTPGSVTIRKAYGDLVVLCKKDGLTAAGGTFESSATGGVWGNVIAGGIIGYAVDASSGAGFDYPTSMTVQFEPPCTPQSAADEEPQPNNS